MADGAAVSGGTWKADGNREVILDDCRAVMDVLGDCSAIEKEMESVTGEMEVVTGLIQKLAVENATRKLDQNDYRRKYEAYVNKYAALESRIEGCPGIQCDEMLVPGLFCFR